MHAKSASEIRGVCKYRMNMIESNQQSEVYANIGWIHDEVPDKQQLLVSVSAWRYRLTSIRIPIVEITWACSLLISTVRFPILGRHPHTETSSLALTTVSRHETLPNENLFVLQDKGIARKVTKSYNVCRYVLCKSYLELARGTGMLCIQDMHMTTCQVQLLC